MAAGAYAVSVDMASAYVLLNQTANANTWLESRIVSDDPGISNAVKHTFKMGSSLADVSSAAAENPGATTVFYDIEHWTATPLAEQQQPVASIAQAAQTVHASGKKFGITPDGLFLGINHDGCTGDINAGILTQIDWTQVDAINIQAQALANNTNCAAYGTQNYTSFVTAVAQYARSKNPNIAILSQVSLRDSSTDWALNAAASVQGSVNAIYVAYPDPCTNCTLTDLTTVITAL